MKSVAAIAEQAALGAVMLRPDLVGRGLLRAEDFGTEAHRVLWACLVALDEAHVEPTPMAILERLTRTGHADCWPTAAQIIAETGSAANFESFAGTVRAEAQRRQLHGLARRILDDTGDVGPIVESAVRELAGIGDRTVSRDYWVDEAAGEAFRQLTEDELPSVPTGYADLDAELGGWYPGDLVVIGARPAMGKTAFGLNLLARGNFVGGLISGEQDATQIGLRNLALHGEVSLHSMRTRSMTDDDWRRASNAVERSRQRRYLIHDAPAPTVEDVRIKARRWRHQYGLQVLVVDYLQKLRHPEGEDFRLKIGFIATELKAMARELGITVVALAQVKRDVDTRDVGDDGTGACPHASDLAESGLIENEADQILTLCRPEVYRPIDPRWRGLAYVTIAKNRHGRVGRLRMAWRGDYLRFENIAADWKSEAVG